MKNLLIFIVFWTQLFAVGIGFSSCSHGAAVSEEKTRSLKVMNWNLQTFFDAQFDGNEYTDFKSAKSGWNEEKYTLRLERLATVITALDADVLVFEELEKEAQLQDISNKLAGTFRLSKLYPYGTFASGRNSSIGCAILSRFPLTDITVHELDVRTSEGTQPAMRAIIRATVLVGEKRLVLFVNHWKSKSGGAEASEVWRKKQEAQLARLMAESLKTEKALLALGDCNKDITEFSCAGNSVVLDSFLRVNSPWLTEDGSAQKTGSYWYKGAWERIDQFFTAGNARVSNFCAENNGVWADSAGYPLRYKLWNGSGYSDHLPLTATVSF